MNKLVNGDCLKEIKLIQDKSIDLVFTSPPYNLGNDHHTGNKKINAYFDDLPEEEYQRQQFELLSECYRVLKDTGSMIYNHKNRIKKGIQISPYEWILKTNFFVKQEVVWFNGSQNFDKIRFYPMTERLYWLAKSPKTKLFNRINHHDIFDINDFKSVGTGGEHKRAFPLKMATDLISCFPDCKTVLDPYMGSGTTGVACKILNLNFVGIELDTKYFDIAKKRIDNEHKGNNIILFNTEQKALF